MMSHLPSSLTQCEGVHVVIQQPESNSRSPINQVISLGTKWLYPMSHLSNFHFHCSRTVCCNFLTSNFSRAKLSANILLLFAQTLPLAVYLCVSMYLCLVFVCLFLLCFVVICCCFLLGPSPPPPRS